MANESSKHTFQLLGFLINIAFFVISLYICIYPGWRRNDPQGDVIENIIRSQGLWFQCTLYTHGSWQCDDYDQFFISLPAVIQGARAFMILAIIMSFISMMLLLPGGRCTVYYTNHPNMKARLAGMSAVLIVISAFCCLVASSWYAAEVVSAYWMQNMPNYSLNNNNFTFSDRFIYGSCIYLGWVNFILGFTSGVLMCCGARQSEEEMEYGMHLENDGTGYQQNHSYGPANFVASHGPSGYIPNKPPVSHSQLAIPKALKPYYNGEPEFAKSATELGHINPSFVENGRIIQRHMQQQRRQKQHNVPSISVQEYV